MGAARSRKAGGQRPKRKVQLPKKYSHDYPVREGHDYVLNSIPRDVWRRAKERAHAEQRSVRFVLIRALELFADGRLPL